MNAIGMVLESLWLFNKQSKIYLIIEKKSLCGVQYSLTAQPLGVKRRVRFNLNILRKKKLIKVAHYSIPLFLHVYLLFFPIILRILAIIIIILSKKLSDTKR